jgi:hypothetical protein
MATTKALLIPFDDTLPVEVIDLDNTDYRNITKIVAPDSGLFTRLGAETFDLFGDDEGLFHPEAHLRINARAMQLYADSVGAKLEDFGSPLVGDWLAVGLPNARGNNTDVPQAVIDFTFTWTRKDQ